MILAGLNANQSPGGNGHLTPIERIGEEEADDSQMVSHQNIGLANTASISGANGPGGANATGSPNVLGNVGLSSDDTAQKEVELLNKIMKFVVGNKVNAMLSFMLTNY